MSFVYNPLTRRIELSGNGNDNQLPTPFEMRVQDGMIQWRLVSEEAWHDLIALTDIIQGQLEKHLQDNQHLIVSQLSNHYISREELDRVIGLVQSQTSATPSQLGSAAQLDAPTKGDARDDQVVLGSDSRLQDAREWSANTVGEEDINDAQNTHRLAWTVQRVWQAITAWWNQNPDKVKLETIAAGATVNKTDAFLLNRINHTGAQPATTITGLSKVAITGNYNHLAGLPMLGEAAKLSVGTNPNTVAAGNDPRFRSLQQGLDAANNQLSALDIKQINDAVAVGDGLVSWNPETKELRIDAKVLRLKGLHSLPCLSRDQGTTTAGTELLEVSNNPELVASTGVTDAHTVPTQDAVRQFVGQNTVHSVKHAVNQPLQIYPVTIEDVDGYPQSYYIVELKTNEPNGLLTLSADGMIPSSLLPGYVDDVEEHPSFDALPVIGNTSTIYVTVDTRKKYRWGGTTYVDISSSHGTTDEVVEGFYHRYFTQERARQSLSGSGAIQYDSSTGKIHYSTPNSDQIKEGSNHLYFTEARSRESISVSSQTGLFYDPQTGLIDQAPQDETSLEKQKTILGLGKNNAPLFESIQLGDCFSKDWKLGVNGSGCYKYVELGSRNSTYTIDITASNHFYLKNPINKQTHIQLDNLEKLGSNYLWTGCLHFEYSAGKINWFSGLTNYTVKWDPCFDEGKTIPVGFNTLRLTVMSAQRLLCITK